MERLSQLLSVHARAIFPIDRFSMITSAPSASVESAVYGAQCVSSPLHCVHLRRLLFHLFLLADRSQPSLYTLTLCFDLLQAGKGDAGDGVVVAVVVSVTVLEKRNVASAVSLTPNLNAPFLCPLSVLESSPSLDLAGYAHPYIIMTSVTVQSPEL